MMLYPASGIKGVSEEKKGIVMNLYLSNIAEEFIATQVDLEIPLAVSSLKDVYNWMYTRGRRMMDCMILANGMTES
jgi:hypothetical protein